MNDKASPRQLLLSLQPGQGGVLYHPDIPTTRITQISRVGNKYYLVGPLFAHYTIVLLEVLFATARRNGGNEAGAVRLLNDLLKNKKVPPEAHVFECSCITDATETIAALFAAYSLR